MSARLSLRPSAGRSPGFVLVGVVIMVLALTILGLSLFSLSSYEAQFMNRAVDGEQALQYAMGGLARARFALASPPGTLANVKSNLPYEHVTYARATQLKPGPVRDSMGVVIGGGNDVEIVVQAEYRGVTRRVAGSYLPTTETNYYKRLMSVGPGGIRVNTLAGGVWAACGTVHLGPLLAGRDSIWLNPASPVWQGCLAPPLISGISYGVGIRDVPTPSVVPFLDAHPPGLGVTTIPFNNASYTLPGTPGVIKYFYTDNTASAEFSSRSTSDLTVKVNGIAVWMLPRGIRAENKWTIDFDTDPDAVLVIVARNGHDLSFNDFGAIWAFGGLHAKIPVIFVTDGNVKIEHFHNLDGFTTAQNLSIFANHVLLTGPPLVGGIPPSPNLLNNIMFLAYGASRMDPIIDQLMAAGALPNAVSTSPFALRPGTWRVVE